MILMLDEQRSNLKKSEYCFVIVYYKQEELEYIRKLPKLEELKFSKFRFYITYIDLHRILKDWNKRGWKVSLDTVDIPKVFGIYSIKRKAEEEEKDRLYFLR
jgi:hypothetical protein